MIMIIQAVVMNMMIIAVHIFRMSMVQVQLVVHIADAPTILHLQAILIAAPSILIDVGNATAILMKMQWLV